MFFDPRDRRLQSGRALQPLPDLPTEGAFGEMVGRFSAEWESARAVERSNSRQLMLGESLQTFLDAYETETGEALDNPYDMPESALSGRGIGPSSELKFGRDLALERAREKYEKARAQPGDRLVSRLPQWPTEEETRQRAIARAQNAEERAERAAALSFTGAGTAGAAAGMLGSVMADPINIASLFVGAPGGAGIVRTMATEAFIGAGAEALLQPSVVAWKRELGQEPGFAEIAGNVAVAGAGAGILAGLFKGAGKAGAAGWRRVRPHLTRDQRAAIHVTDALDTIDRRNPFEIAKRARVRAERTGAAPSATFADELRAGTGDDLAFTVELDRLAREVGDTLAALDPARGAGAPGSIDILMGLLRPRDRELIERTASTSRTRKVQQSIAEKGQRNPIIIKVIDENEVTLIDGAHRLAALRNLGIRDVDIKFVGTKRRPNPLPPPAFRAGETPIEATALHHRAAREAEASLLSGQRPDGPAIRAVDEALPELELPVWEARTGKGRTIRWRGPMDILTWARTIGGLKDDAGELAARDLEKLNRGRTGVDLAKGEVFLGRLVNNDNGVNLDEAALRAWEAGYFPGATERPTPDDLLAALDRTVAAGGDVDGRVWSEQDAELVDQMRNRIDPGEEAHFREIMGDEWTDDALDAIDGMPVVEEPISPELADLMTARAGGRAADEIAPEAVDFNDEVERMTLEALQDDLDAGDFNVTVEDVTDEGEAISRPRSAREVWKETQDEAAGMRDAAACMTGGAADAA